MCISSLVACLQCMCASMHVCLDVKQPFLAQQLKCLGAVVIPVRRAAP